jgi:hypothetical protein
MEKKKTTTTPRKPVRNLSVRKLTKKELTDVTGARAALRPTPGCCTQGCCG